MTERPEEPRPRSTDTADSTITSRSMELELNQMVLELYHLMERWQRYGSGLERELDLRERRLAELEVRARSLEVERAVLGARLRSLTSGLEAEGR